jgi:hypothetical protein
LICTAWRAVRPPARRSRGCWTGRTGSSRSPGANLPPRERPRPSASVGRTQYRNQNQKQPWCRPQSNREPAPPTAPIRSNARGKPQSRALAIHSPVRTALAPAVGCDFAKVLWKLPPEELERCSELLYNQRATRVPKQQRAATLGGTFAVARSREHGLPHQRHGLHPSLSHRDRGTIPRGSISSGFGRASFGVTHPGGAMMLWL